MKVVLIVLVLLTAAVFTGALIWGPQLRNAVTGLTPEPRGTPVRAEPAAVGTLVETVQAPGGIEPHVMVQLAAEVSARIVELPFDEGDAVRRGDIVCKLDDKDLRAMLRMSEARRDGERFRLQSDQARLEGLRSNLAFARRELERIQTLYESGDRSRRDLDQATERVDDLQTSVEATTHSISVAESSLAAAEADIERSQDGLEDTVIVAPIDGHISMLSVEVGESVTGSQSYPGTVLMTIADFSRMILNAEVAESDVAALAVGQKAKIRINAFPDEVFSGTVRQIALQRSISENGTGYFKTEVEIDLQDREIRLSGLKANVDIEIATHNGIVVPYQSIVIRDVESLPDVLRTNSLVDRTKHKMSVVYRVVDNKAICTPVKVGPSDLTHRLVLEGLPAGEPIIVGPYKVLETIKHDEAVRIESDQDAQEAEDARAAPPESGESDGDEAAPAAGASDQPAAEEGPPAPADTPPPTADDTEVNG